MTRNELVLIALALALMAAGGILLAAGHVWAVALIVVGLLIVGLLFPISL